MVRAGHAGFAAELLWTRRSAIGRPVGPAQPVLSDGTFLGAGSFGAPGDDVHGNRFSSAYFRSLQHYQASYSAWLSATPAYSAYECVRGRTYQYTFRELGDVWLCSRSRDV